MRPNRITSYIVTDRSGVFRWRWVWWRRKFIKEEKVTVLRFATAGPTVVTMTREEWHKVPYKGERK